MAEGLLGGGNSRYDSIHGAWPEQLRPSTIEPTQNPELFKNFQYQLGNRDLPIASYREYTQQTIDDNPVTVLSSATGTGKTTQLPQWLLESDYKRIIVLQPRVLAARLNSERVRQEMVDALGAAAAKLVGYKTAHEGDYSPENRIVFRTDGLQVQYELSGNGIQEDEVMIIDELHEMNERLALLLAISKRRVEAKPDSSTRFILASATMNAQRYANFFEDVTALPVPVLNIPGRTYEVIETTADNAYEAAIERAQQGKNIAIVVPGKDDTSATLASLRGKVPEAYTLVPLHGEQTNAQQDRAIRSYEGGKIIASTNVIQSSVTIPDLDVIIDCCYERTNDNKNDTPWSGVVPISMASEEQRRGRVGRSKPGEYIRAQLPGLPPPISKEERGDYDVPEILRKRVDSTALKLGRIAIKVEHFGLLDQPEEQKIANAYERLQKIRAMNGDGTLTDIGLEMTGIPLDPHYARMVVESRNFSDAVRMQMLAAVASMQETGITLTGAADAKKWEKLSKDAGSDILANLDVFVMALDMNADELQKHGIVERKFYKALGVLLSLMEREGIEITDLQKPNKTEREALLHCILTGTDEVLVHVGGGRYKDKNGNKRRIGRESAAGKAKSKLITGAPFTLSKTSDRGVFDRLYVHDATAVTIEQIIQSMPDRCTFKTLYYYLDEQKQPKVKKEVFFDDLPTKSFVIEDAPPSAELRDYIVDFTVDNPFTDDALPRTTHLKQTIKALKNLHHRSIEPFDADEIIDRIATQLKSEAPDTVTAPKDLEEHIDFVSLETYVDKAVIDKIKQTSPRTITVDEKRINVSYEDGVAYITLPADMRTHVPTEIPELGDRPIFVRFNYKEPYRTFLDAQNASIRLPRDQHRRKRGAVETPHYAVDRLDTATPIMADVMTRPASFTKRPVQIVRGRMRSR